MLDEPTSGLDSLTAFIICSHLRRLCQDKNKTVHSGDKLRGKTEPIEIDPELKEQKT